MVETPETSLVPFSEHPMDTDANRDLFAKLMSYYYAERDKQALNRVEQALDADFYDGYQWLAEDAEILMGRGQMPLVYDEVAPMVDWIIGTERRMRTDWKVLPRTEDDVDMADIKTKTLKYVSDINAVTMARSRAFADAAKSGVGWLDDGVRDDPTRDILFSRYEDWRNVLWDSSSYDLDLSDARYVIRWRYVDEDIAVLMFPDREEVIRRAARDAGTWIDDESWQQNDGELPVAPYTEFGNGLSTPVKRRVVKLYEFQYRSPCRCRVVADGSHKGAYLGNDDALNDIVGPDTRIIDRMAMRVHFAVTTAYDLLSNEPSQYRHNDFTLTPVWCYRRGSNRLPYGMIRRVRDIQQDLNKRASKALFLLNTNQVIADKGAVDDPRRAAEEVAHPNGWIEKNPGKEFTIRRDSEAANGQIEIMSMQAQSIQRISGINNENLGRQTNAISGEAIKARQNQGSVSTTEPFDNLLYAVQCQGRKQLSLVEQYYSEPKVIRLTGAKGRIEWVKVNQPESQPDGSIRYLNDITASMADFVVSEQDYAGTLRQVMFDSLQAMVQKLPPELGLRLYAIAMQFSDLPNADEIVNELRRITGEPDPDKEPSPEEQEKAQQNAALQAEAMQMQREQAVLALDEQRAKIAKLQAEAARISGGEDVQAGADTQLERLSEELRRVQTECEMKILGIKQDADVSVEVARIAADSRIRVAEIQQQSDKRIAALEARLNINQEAENVG